MRIRVIDILDLLSNGLSPQEILVELPDLEAEDIRAAILYARRRVDHSTHSSKLRLLMAGHTTV